MTTPNFRALLANDAYAASFQSLGQYRTALLKALDAAPPPEPPTDEELDDFIMFWWGHYGDKWFFNEDISFDDIRTIVCAALEKWGNH